MQNSKYSRPLALFSLTFEDRLNAPQSVIINDIDNSLYEGNDLAPQDIWSRDTRSPTIRPIVPITTRLPVMGSATRPIFTRAATETYDKYQYFI